MAGRTLPFSAMCLRGSTRCRTPGVWHSPHSPLPTSRSTFKFWLILEQFLFGSESVLPEPFPSPVSSDSTEPIHGPRGRGGEHPPLLPIQRRFLLIQPAPNVPGGLLWLWVGQGSCEPEPWQGKWNWWGKVYVVLMYPTGTGGSGTSLLRAASQGDPLLSLFLAHRSTGQGF